VKEIRVAEGEFKVFQKSKVLSVLSEGIYERVVNFAYFVTPARIMIQKSC
jgi:hypothetical protein